MLAALQWTTDYEAIRGAEFVLEAATEDKALKGRIFGQVERLVAKDAILASNSSHLEPEVIFAAIADTSRTTVIHYFFPAERNLVVEIVPSAQTSPKVTDWLMSFYEAIGKVPVRVKSRYGYALDPIFEGVFLAAARIAESGRATTKQIDAVATKALGMTVGSFTAMNLTGGNPITAVGLDNYTTKINGWFGTPKLLKDAVAEKRAWDVPGRGEDVAVPPELAREITDGLRGAYFGLCGEIVDAGLITVGDFDMALELALDMKPAFRFMNELGTDEALRLVEAYAQKNPGFPVAKCIRMHGVEAKPFAIPVVQRVDRDGIAVLTIRRPKVLNALNQGVFDEIRDKVAAIEKDDSIRGVVLTGFGAKAFVSGADVGFLAKIQDRAQGEATSRASQRVVDFVAAAKKPIVCAMNGLAFGGGNELAMACTMRIARRGQKVFVAQPEPNLGIIPGAGGSQRLPRLIGLERAARMLRTGKPISSANALEWGLISEEVDGDLVGRAVELARELADGKRPRPKLETGPLRDVPSELPPVDIGHLSRKVDAILCKAILDGARGSLADGIEIETKAFGDVCGTKDMRIGVDNFQKNGPRAPAPFVHE
jgi:enoyl-CoA hydratase/3-hydroxyacyl-CoA dehydrogenase